MQHPLAVCNVCGLFAYGQNQVDQQCAARPDGKKRCRGNFDAAVHYTFKVCSACGGAGCEQCERRGLIAERFKPGK